MKIISLVPAFGWRVLVANNPSLITVSPSPKLKHAVGWALIERETHPVDVAVFKHPGMSRTVELLINIWDEEGGDGDVVALSYVEQTLGMGVKIFEPGQPDPTQEDIDAILADVQAGIQANQDREKEIIELHLKGYSVQDIMAEILQNYATVEFTVRKYNEAKAREARALGSTNSPYGGSTINAANEHKWCYADQDRTAATFPGTNLAGKPWLGGMRTGNGKAGIA
jgi:hypothetical protein